MFTGLSLLRAKEKTKQPLSEQAKKLQNYLAQQYGGSVPGAGGEPKKKKKKKRPEAAAGVRILDEDVTGFAAVKRAVDARQEEEMDEDDEDQPVVVNPEEAERLRLLKEKEQRYFAQEQDGSGWASLQNRSGSPDASPPRRRPRHDSPDASPPRRREQASPDASPPRRRPRHDSPDASPPRRREQASPDASPPRRQRHDSDSDASPAWRPRQQPAAVLPDASPPWRQQQQAGAEDLSPPRKRSGADAGEQPESDAAKRQRMMSDGTMAGMVSGRELAAEMQRKRAAERERFAELGRDVTGRGAETVYRGKEGQRLTKEEYQEQQAAARKKAEYEAEKDLAWGGGLKQRQEAEARMQEMRSEAAKPFARSRDDADLDSLQRNQLRWGDPMAHLVKRKQPLLEEPPTLLEGAHGEKLKKSGFIIPQQVPPHSWLRRGVGAPPNRYSIKPGRHWDGVDRSNGFEQKMFKTQTELRRREQEAWEWAQEDM